MVYIRHRVRDVPDDDAQPIHHHQHPPAASLSPTQHPTAPPPQPRPLLASFPVVEGLPTMVVVSSAQPALTTPTTEAFNALSSDQLTAMAHYMLSQPSGGPVDLDNAQRQLAAQKAATERLLQQLSAGVVPGASGLGAWPMLDGGVGYTSGDLMTVGGGDPAGGS